MYLLHLLKRVKTSVMASDYTQFIHLFSVFFTASMATAFNSSSTGSGNICMGNHAIKVFIGHGEWYVFTRLPRVLAKSEFIRSIINSQLIDTVVFKWHLMENKITDCIHPKEIHQFIRIDYVPFGFTHLCHQFCKSQGCPNTCLGSGKSRAISMMGQ